MILTPEELEIMNRNECDDIQTLEYLPEVQGVSSESYRVNGKMYVPVDTQNPDYIKIIKFLELNPVILQEKQISEVVAEKEQFENSVQLLKDVSSNQQFLNETDFYVIRKYEENIDIPTDIITRRAEAKEFLRSNNITYTV